MKGGIGLRRKIIDGDRYLSYLKIFWVYKEKFVKNDSYRRNFVFGVSLTLNA